MMGRIYFEHGRAVKPPTDEKKGMSTYHITVAGQRLSVRATHHDLIGMLPGIMRGAAQGFLEVRHG